MTEKLKYKVGDKVLIEAEVTERYKGIGDLRDQIEGFDIKVSSEIIMPKPKIPQEVMDWYFKHQERHWDVDSYLTESDESGEVYSWLFTGNRQLNSEHQHALATLIAYGPKAVEVEKEKMYLVTLKSTGQLLARTADGFFFGTNDPYFKDSQYEFTKQELIDAGFGVFDSPMFEMEEVD